MNRITVLALLFMLSACKEQKEKSADLPDRSNKWVNTIALQADSKMTHVGKTSTIMVSTEVKPLISVMSVAIGDEIDGVRIGAIECVFFNKDASYSGQQFMWRGRWGCKAGRNRDEVSNAVKDDGTKAYDYIFTSPVSLN